MNSITRGTGAANAFSSRVARNVIYNLAGQATLVVANLLIAKVVYRALGGDALGIVFASLTLAAILTATLELGASTTTVREVSTFARTDPDYIRRLLGTAALLYWSAYSVLAVVVYLAAPYLASMWIRPQELDMASATAALRVFGIGALTILPRSLYVSVLRGLERMHANNLIDAAVAVAQLIGTIVIVALGGTLAQVGLWFVGCYVAGTASYIAVVARFVGLRSIIPRLSVDVLQRNASFASRMFLISLTSTVHAQTDRLFVSKLLPLESFGFYSLAARIVSTATLPAAAVVQAAFPSLSIAIRARNDLVALARYRRLQGLLSFGMVPVLAAVAFAATPVFSFVLESSAAAALFVPTTLLCVAYYLNVTMQIPYVYSLASDRAEIAAKWNVSALALLPVAGFLVYAFGLAGAAFATVVYQLWAYAYMIRRICNECLGMPAWSWYGEILRIGLLSATTYGVALAVTRRIEPDDPFLTIGAFALASAIYIGFAYRLAGIELRELLRQAGDRVLRIALRTP